MRALRLVIAFRFGGFLGLDDLVEEVFHFSRQNQVGPNLGQRMEDEARSP